MKIKRNTIRRLTALMMCFMLFAGRIPVPAMGEDPAADPVEFSGTAGESVVTPTDLTEEPDSSPYEQTVILNGARLTITADGGVIAEGEALTVETANEEAFAQAAEAASGIEPGDPRIVRHTQYRISGAEINGSANVRIEGIGLKELNEQYPDAEITINVYRYEEGEEKPEDRAGRVDSETDTGRDAVTFSIGSTGLYDVMILVLPLEPEYTISFDPDGGSETEPITQKAGTAVTAPGDPVRDGYIFDVWEPEIPETMPAEDMTVKARWHEKPVPAPEPTPEPTPEQVPTPVPTPTPEPDAGAAQTPTLKDRGTKSITVETREGEEYSINYGRTWQTDGKFSGLVPNTEYRIVARMKATDNLKAGKMSEALKVRTQSASTGTSSGTAKTGSAALSSGKKVIKEITMAFLLARDIIPPASEGDSALPDSDELNRILEKYGEDNVIMIGFEDPVMIAGTVPDDPDAAENLADQMTEAGYNMLIPAGLSFGEEWIAACRILEENDIPVLAANLYYDGGDGEHEEGENVLTPYVIEYPEVNGEIHMIGILGLLSEMPEDPETSGYTTIHPDNPDGTLSGETAFWVEQMQDDGCEFIIVCCYGIPAEDDDVTDNTVKTLVSENTDISLMMIACGDGKDGTEESVQDADGVMVPVIYGKDGLTETAFLFRENDDGDLVWERQ